MRGCPALSFWTALTRINTISRDQEPDLHGILGDRACRYEPKSRRDAVELTRKQCVPTRNETTVVRSHQDPNGEPRRVRKWLQETAIDAHTSARMDVACISMKGVVDNELRKNDEQPAGGLITEVLLRPVS